MTSRVRIGLLSILAALWLILAALSLVHGRVLVGVMYLACGGVLAALARKFAQGRR